MDGYAVCCGLLVMGVFHMNHDDSTKLRIFGGHKRIVMVERLEPDGSLLMGGYSISYDHEGNETDRTEITWNGRITGFSECLPQLAARKQAGKINEW